MSRKDYVEAARIIREAREHVYQEDGEYDATGAALLATREIAKGLADMFKRDNSRFDRQKFLVAAGLED